MLEALNISIFGIAALAIIRADIMRQRGTWLGLLIFLTAILLTATPDYGLLGVISLFLFVGFILSWMVSFKDAIIFSTIASVGATLLALRYLNVDVALIAGLACLQTLIAACVILQILNALVMLYKNLYETVIPQFALVTIAAIKRARILQYRR